MDAIICRAWRTQYSYLVAGGKKVERKCGGECGGNDKNWLEEERSLGHGPGLSAAREASVTITP